MSVKHTDPRSDCGLICGEGIGGAIFKVDATIDVDADVDRDVEGNVTIVNKCREWGRARDGHEMWDRVGILGCGWASERRREIVLTRKSPNPPMLSTRSTLQLHFPYQCPVVDRVCSGRAVAASRSWLKSVRSQKLVEWEWEAR